MPCEHEDGHLQAKERGLEQILFSQPSEEINPENTLISDFWPPELWENELLFKPPVYDTLLG